MAEKVIAKAKSKSASYYVKALIGIAIMIFFGYIPAPEPMTQLGMQVIGQFIGLVFLWTFVDMVWPTFLGIILFGFIAQQVYPNSFALAGIYEAGAQSLGGWIIILVIGLLLFTEVLNETGLIRRMALWFITGKTARKGGWKFTFMMLLSFYVVGLFFNVTAAQVVLFAFIKEIFELTGMTKDDKWTKVITIGTTFICIVTYCMTPFSHDLTLLFMGIYSAIAGVVVNWLAYMGVAIPVGTLILLGMYCWFRFFVKPDMSKLKNIDFEALEKLRPGPMSSKEKFIVIVSALLFFSWIFPGFLSVIAPHGALLAWFDRITMTTPLYVVIVLFAIVHFDGKPVLNIAEAAGKISWFTVFFLAGIMMIATAMGEETTGISAWVMSWTSPMVAHLSPFAMTAVFAIMSCVLTNICNNIPVGIVFTTVGVPLALQMGINPFIPIMAIVMGAQFAYCIPPAFVPIGFCYADPYGGGKYTFRWGVVMVVISCVVGGLLIYPLASVIGG